MTRLDLLASCALPLALFAGTAAAQNLQDRAVAPPAPETPAAAPAPAADEDQVNFSAGALEYDYEADIVTATSDVRMFRAGQRLRADKVVWNRKTGKVVASGNIAVTNPEGDTAYGDSIELTDSLKGGMVDNMLVVLERGGRLAAERGTRAEGGTISLERAAYTACSVVDSEGCPKEPTWKVTAVRVTYRPDRERVYYTGAQVHLFGLPSIPLPKFSHPVGDDNASGLLAPTARYDRINGFEVATPYLFRLAPNRKLTVTPHVYTAVLPMLEANYEHLNELGAFSVTGYATSSRRSDDLSAGFDSSTEKAFRGYLDGAGRLQFDDKWSLSGSLRLASDRTFLRRYDISRVDRLRTTVALERIDRDSYFSLAGWATQTLRVGERQGLQPVALPEIDYRRRMNGGLLGGAFQFQLNTLALGRHAGQDTQRAFASVRWDLRRLTNWGQEVTFTAFARADAYNTNDTAATAIASYRGLEGFQSRGIGAVAVDVRWPFVGAFGSGTQRITPRLQIVASPKIENLDLPNEDARAIDLEDSNLFALNRFAGYDRWEDSSRATYGLEWNIDLPGFSLATNIGQSYRLNDRPTILPSGTGLSDRFSDIVGRTSVRFRDFVSLTHRYRLDKGGLAVRRNEVDATVGSRSTYVLVGYLRLNRDIDDLEDLQDREEIRVGGRVQFARFWSAFASGIVDLTDRSDDVFSLSDGFDPIRHRFGIQYEDDCLTLGATWRHDYRTTGDVRSGSSVLLTLALKNLGR
ncbi:LPS-assembly protein LptD [Sphingomonas jeddahensis]|uniref:LPS-assembly protein LptD n=1 Tax=Sphingomonas jeddahensis TaxID=1915074 RepID=A0A1V2ESD4_9SPHN|nr:LPS assembly protein LptD [Sphingomonas jeddahensis]ONF95490.1 LPS-assembly protein LptD precursor [Sphingomonas jeddahensis]